MLYQTTLAGGPVPPPEPNSEIYPIDPISSPVWGDRIEPLARAMGHRVLTTEKVFEAAHRCLGVRPKGWSERRTRCVLALGVGVRFAYELGTWRVILLPMRRPEWRWSEEWGAWYVVGMERQAVIRHEEEIRDLARVSERFEMALREKRRDVGRSQ